MKLNEAYPGNFLKAADLNGQSVTVTIQSVTLEELGKGRDAESKLIIAFAGKDKKLICNKTNARTIEKLYGDETDNWVGKRITIAPREVEFQGDMVWAIRVSLQNPGAPQAPAKPTTRQQSRPAPRPELEPEHDPDVPFNEPEAIPA